VGWAGVLHSLLGSATSITQPLALPAVMVVAGYEGRQAMPSVGQGSASRGSGCSTFCVWH
jgi:hypothetical protein